MSDAEAPIYVNLYARNGRFSVVATQAGSLWYIGFRSVERRLLRHLGGAVAQVTVTQGNIGIDGSGLSMNESRSTIRKASESGTSEAR